MSDKFTFNIKISVDSVEDAIRISNLITGKTKVAPVCMDKEVKEDIKLTILNNIPTEDYAKIGKLYENFCDKAGQSIVYKTYYRYVNALAVEGLLLTQKINGGKEGKTTMIKRLY
jgi:sulfatase maturation enzyme AslB (radical SAM superfamily)